MKAARAAAHVHSMPLRDGVTAYDVHGDRGPWVVLVHGLVTPMYCWESMAGTLAHAGFRVLRYDHFGRGLSDRPDMPYDRVRYVDQLRQLVDSLGIHRAHFIGWSMGCIITSSLAMELPDLVDRHV